MTTPPATIKPDVLLSPLTTIGIGGPARWFARVESVDAVREALQWADGQGIPVLILGGGSNLLIADGGFDGLVIQIGLRGITAQPVCNQMRVRGAAGENWDDFVAHAVSHGWAGIECLSGIPGSVGATPIQNVGAYGQEVCQTIESVDVLERATGTMLTLSNADCRFSYRNSHFKSAAPDQYVVLSVTFRLTPGGCAMLGYPELRRNIEQQCIDPCDLPAVRQAVLTIRRSKGMVIDPSDPDSRSDGSFFTNPILDASEYEAFCRRIAEAGLAACPNYPAGDRIKLPAAWLIEQAGFHKGFTLGNVGLSSKHTLAIINRGGGTAAEVLQLVRLIQDGVRDRFGVALHPEPNLVGF